MAEANIASLEVLVQQSRRRLARLPLPAAVERYFDVSLYLLIVTGFATLASTGRLDALSLTVVSAALLFRGYLLLRNRKVLIPERWTSYFTIAYVLFYVADYYFFSGAFVAATVHLVLFSMVVKIFSVQRDRDHLYLAILSFLAVLAAAILTVDSVFLAAFSAFLLLAVTTFVSMEMKRSSQAALARAREGMGPAPRAMAIALSGAGLAIVVSILLFAAGIFFILPRLSAGYLSNFAPQNQWVSGFSDNVRLGEIGQIKQSDTVVMHVQIEGDHGSASEMKWRGIALAIFDGRRWYNPINQYAEQSSPNGRFNLLGLETRLGNLPAAAFAETQFRSLSYRVTMEPLGTNVLFLASVPTTVVSRIQRISVDEGGSVFNLDRSRLIESYVATSRVPQPDLSVLRASSGRFPPAIALRYLQLPRLDNRVRALAQQITATAATDFDKALALEQYLKTHYGYTLQMGYTLPRDPLAYFLFDRKQGHCEYFASSMAVMLRAIGIPARVVNGFRGSDYNDLTGSYIIRGRHAHSWVEVYISGFTWVPFDPTPPDPARADTRWARFLLYVDAAREFWREWVINYDFRHQETLTNAAVAESRDYFQRLGRWVRRAYESLLERARRLQERAADNPEPWSFYGIAAVVGMVLLLNLPRLWRALRQHGIARKPERAPQAAASIWYLRLTRSLARRGWPKLPSQTPQEFAASVDDPALATLLAQFTAHYERARFGDSAAAARLLPELFNRIRAQSR
jgi:transglutaminase-like putative cysteine protease